MAVGLWQEERDMLSLHHHRRGAGAITLHGSDRSESGQVAGADLDILVWGGCTVADPERYENPSTSRGVCPPQEIFDSQTASGAISEANILPKLYQKFWGIS